VATLTAEPETPSRPSPRRRSKVPIGPYIALIPVFAMLALFQYYPAISGIVYSFFDWKPASTSTFLGLANYRTMIDDSIWWLSFRNLGFIFIFGIVSWVIPLITAELLITLHNERTQHVFRTLLIVPMAFPGVVTALVWSFMYHP